MEPVSVGLYPRNTTAVKTGLLQLRRGDPEAVILVGAYQPVGGVDCLGQAYRNGSGLYDGILCGQQRPGRGTGAEGRRGLCNPGGAFPHR